MAAKYEIEKFNGKKFSLWKLKMKAILRKDNCLSAIEDKLNTIANDKWKEMDEIPVANMHLALADSALSSVAEKKMAKEICDALVKLYEVKSLHTRIFLKRKLYTLRMSESTSVMDHMNNLNTLFSQLTASDYKIVENERAELLLQSLPDSYDQLIININNNYTADHLIFDDVAGAILEEESRRKNKEDRSESSKQAEVLTVTRGRSMERDSSGSHGQGATWHMTSKRDWFCTYEPISEGYVFMGNYHTLEIAGFGIVKLQMYDGTVRTIQDVRHVKGLKKTLLSIGQLDDLGCKTYTIGGILKVMKGALVVVVSRDVIFAENELPSEQRNDSTVKETTTVQIDEKFGDDDSSEVEPEHNEQVPDEVNDTEVQRSSRQTRPPSWHSDYVMTSHDAYCLLTEE
ncbi:Retrovirus-related Pol polyprotein from transposon TNT 1-94 [Senna tora]|uniref:Retrovirus-related Pol polyprotein from transposon TNT 1-94 n=1 Tax=Senna tora TaxID=362788 RepID=A0A834WL67_9FABA|nr:Retrovirus-related Pol polyprotein from transposon TNT 1-94 [Senna tora]